MDNLPTSVYKILYEDEIKKIKVLINILFNRIQQINNLKWRYGRMKWWAYL